MSKVRINDLARELEVKSRSILDALTAVGVTRKTHSSSIEADEAEKVRDYFKNGGRSSSASKPAVESEAEVRPVQGFQAGRRAEGDPGAQAGGGGREGRASAPPRGRRRSARMSSPLPRAKAGRCARAMPRSRSGDCGRAVAARGGSCRCPGQAPIIAAAAGSGDCEQAAGWSGDCASAGGRSCASRRDSTGRQARGSSGSGSGGSRVEAAPVVPAARGWTLRLRLSPPPAGTQLRQRLPAPAGGREPEAAAPAGPAVPRRVIMPQTGPRPIYTAPPAASCGVPQRGRPIFERPRPQVSGQRRAPAVVLNDGSGCAASDASDAYVSRVVRRPGWSAGTSWVCAGEHGRGLARDRDLVRVPVERQVAPGARRDATSRDASGGTSGSAPWRPALREDEGRPDEGLPAATALRRGAASRTSRCRLPKTITVTEGISVKDLAEKLDVRGKDLIATLLMKGVFVTVNQSLEGELVKDVSRQFGADATVITVEEQLENEAIEGFLEDTTGMVEIVAFAGGYGHGPRRPR